ncbi:MAG TPA: anti-sigma factor [Candidatus Omnitrophota bacterium]|jgi:mycothiol system anti-sigma-R factor|nr:anti-sigma factor [Candidatus Omnitrophota bacterium]
MDCHEVRDRLGAFLDEELDPVTSHAVAEHVRSCGACAAELERQRRLRDGLRRGLEYHQAPAALRARVVRDLNAATPRSGWLGLGAGWAWQWVGAAAAFVLVAGGAWLAGSQSTIAESNAIVGDVVTGHVRSLMAGHLTDVASTDQHTVKPWFAGKLDFSPPVTDFAAEGYPLIGGRLDYLHGRSVAALVYERHKHVINVFVWPTTENGEAMTRSVTRQGFHVIHGRKESMAYWIVSDLNAEELEQFARLLAPARG